MDGLSSIQEAYFINKIPYADLPQSEKDIIDKAAEKLKDLEYIFLAYDSKLALNLITENPLYYLLIQTEFDNELTGKLVWAYISSKQELNSASQ